MAFWQKHNPIQSLTNTKVQQILMSYLATIIVYNHRR